MIITILFSVINFHHHIIQKHITFVEASTTVELVEVFVRLGNVK